MFLRRTLRLFQRQCKGRGLVSIGAAAQLTSQPDETKQRTRISKGVQISIPATIRHRWGTSTVALEDQGDRIVIEPAADDPIAAVEGALADDFSGMDLARLRRAARNDEQLSEARRAR